MVFKKFLQREIINIHWLFFLHVILIALTIVNGLLSETLVRTSWPDFPCSSFSDWTKKTVSKSEQLKSLYIWETLVVKSDNIITRCNQDAGELQTILAFCWSFWIEWKTAEKFEPKTESHICLTLLKKWQLQISNPHHKADPLLRNNLTENHLDNSTSAAANGIIFISFLSGPLMKPIYLAQLFSSTFTKIEKLFKPALFELPLHIFLKLCIVLIQLHLNLMHYHKRTKFSRIEVKNHLIRNV